MTGKTIEILDNDVLLGISAIDEKMELPFSQPSPWLEKCRHQRRRQEVIAVHRLLREMTGDENLVLAHHFSGKPLLSGWNVSVSHTHGHVAAILSRKQNVAVDIEARSDRVFSIAKRLLRADEHADNQIDLLSHWCAKETAYKFYSEQRLQLDEMRVTLPSALGQSGQVENLRTDETLKFDIRITREYVLAYAIENHCSRRT